MSVETFVYTTRLIVVVQPAYLVLRLRCIRFSVTSPMRPDEQEQSRHEQTNQSDQQSCDYSFGMKVLYEPSDQNSVVEYA